MDWVLNLYAAQPFWLWLAVGVVLLSVEAMASTEWLLWPAAAAGVTALLAAIFPLGIGLELGLFGALTVVMTLASRRLVKRVNPSEAPDINDVNRRLIGQSARVVHAFEDGQGRVYISGAEWPADLVSGTADAGDQVVVQANLSGRLQVAAQDEAKD